MLQVVAVVVMIFFYYLQFLVPHLDVSQRRNAYSVQCREKMHICIKTCVSSSWKQAIPTLLQSHKIHVNKQHPNVECFFVLSLYHTTNKVEKTLNSTVLETEHFLGRPKKKNAAQRDLNEFVTESGFFVSLCFVFFFGFSSMIDDNILPCVLIIHWHYYCFECNIHFFLNRKGRKKSSTLFSRQFVIICIFSLVCLLVYRIWRNDYNRHKSPYCTHKYRAIGP